MLGVKLFSAVAIFGLLIDVDVAHSYKIVCYYDSRAFWRIDTVKVGAEELKPALNYCTYLVYGYVGIDHENFRAKSLNPKLDLPESKNVKDGIGNFKSITALKKAYPNLTILLSIGGNVDIKHRHKYLTTLETPKSRTEFATTISNMAKENDFDGVDLAWQFPAISDEYKRNILSKYLGIEDEDSKESAHKEQFTALVREVKGVLNANNCPNLTVSILPHVNSSVYMDFPRMQKYVDHFALMTYDFRTPDRAPKLADYASPLRVLSAGRLAWQNIEWQVKNAVALNVDRDKLVLGISTSGRTWTMDKRCDPSGVPLVQADGPGERGTYTNTDGLLAYYEICLHLADGPAAHTSLTMYRRVPDSNKNLGTYAFRLANKNAKGIWISFEEPETAKQKAAYAKENNLGGLALMDLSLDDARGLCDSLKYPILKAVWDELNLHPIDIDIRSNFS